MPGLKRKTITKIIESKLKDWLSTLPEQLREEVKDHIIVTGGCIASMLLGEPVKDFDLYCDDVETAHKLAVYYVALFNATRTVKGDCTSQPYVKVGEDRVHIYVKSAGIAGEDEDGSSYEYFEQTGGDIEGYLEKVTAPSDKEARYRPVFLSENAITLSDKIQIVIRFTGHPGQIHENYDYVHATNYYWAAAGELCLYNSALESLLSKSLIYQGSLYPICSLFRMRKFMDRGWHISAGEITKMALQISELDLKDPGVLREQLIGVDAAYFHQLIRLITEWREQHPTEELASSYVIDLIDKLSGDL